MLTKNTIDNLQPKEKLYRLSDKTGNGLSLEVSPEGSKRWRFRYRFKGAAKMISLMVETLLKLETLPARRLII